MVCVRSSCQDGREDTSWRQRVLPPGSRHERCSRQNSYCRMHRNYIRGLSNLILSRPWDDADATVVVARCGVDNAGLDENGPAPHSALGVSFYSECTTR